jgi:hypothetical protein
MATGLGSIYKDCQATPEPDDCPVGSARVFGTIREVNNKWVEDIAYCSNFDPTDRTTWKDCFIGIIINCQNPDPNAPKSPKGVATPYYYPFPWESGGLAFSCDKNGNCKENLLFDPDIPEDVCKNGWIQVGTGTILRFIQSADFCKGGYLCPEGTVSAGGGSRVATAVISTDTGRCPNDKEVLNGKICYGEPGLLDENIGWIDGVKYSQFVGGPYRIFEICTYVDPPTDPTDADAYYDCKPCTPKTWDDSVSPAKVIDWTCPTS